MLGRPGCARPRLRPLRRRGCLELAAGRLHLLKGLQPSRFGHRRTQVGEDSDLEGVIFRVESARSDAVVGRDAADVDVVDAGLLEHVEQVVAPRVDSLERRVRGVVAALAHDGLDELLADQVCDRRHERSARRADDAVRRPGGQEVRCVGEMVLRVLVVVARGDHELVLGLEVADVSRDHRADRQAVGHRKAAALDKVGLQIDRQQCVPHDRSLASLDWLDGIRDSSGRAHSLRQVWGSLQDLPAKSLGAHAIRAALDRAGAKGADVDYVIMGQVLQAGAGQITARQAAIEAGIPQEVPAITINKVCLSGINAIALADQLIRAGEVEVVVAGGMESMSEAPYLLPKARFGARMGNTEMIDSMVHDGLWSTFTEQHMGEGSDEVNRELEISREEQDAWAARSHQRAERAWDSGVLADEVVPVEVRQQRGDPLKVARDEGVRPGTTAEALARLAPAFKKDGTITAGNASQISDGAAAVVVMSPERARKAGVEPLAEVVAHGMSADRYSWLHTVPALAMSNALKKAGLDVS